jgi:hypothetical protein
VNTKFLFEKRGYHSDQLAIFLHASMSQLLEPLAEAEAAVASAEPVDDAEDVSVEGNSVEGNNVEIDVEDTSAMMVSPLDLLVIDLCVVALRLAGRGRSLEVERRAAFRDLKSLMNGYTMLPFKELHRIAVREYIRKPGVARMPYTLELLSEYDSLHTTRHSRLAVLLFTRFAGAFVNQGGRSLNHELQALNQLRKLLSA